MRQALVALIVGTVLSGLAAAYASIQPSMEPGAAVHESAASN